MDYTLYSAEDFAADESFVSYHLKNDEEKVLFWENWTTLHPEKLDEIYNAERLLDLMTLQLNDEEIAFEFNRLEAYLTQEKQPAEVINAKKSFSISQLTLVACIGLAVLTFVGLWGYLKQPKTPALEMVSRNNPFGQRSIFVLNDGTKVTLNANSTITFPRIFAQNSRTIILNGEAFFEVTKDKHRPFKVKTGQITTTVLGTKFNVNTNLQNHAIAIALVEGRVVVTDVEKNGEISLEPSEMVTYSVGSKGFVKTNFVVKDVTSWKDGTLVFKNASFDDIAFKIYNTYGVTLINANKKSNWSFTGQFYNSDYLTVIKNICYAKKLKYKSVNDTIIIK